jgi:hypothetical protein
MNKIKMPFILRDLEPQFITEECESSLLCAYTSIMSIQWLMINIRIKVQCHYLRVSRTSYLMKSTILPTAVNVNILTILPLK